MAYTPNFQGYSSPASGVAQAAALDQGLRAYMLRVYNWMSSGLLLTGIVAYSVANTSLINLFYREIPTEYGMRLAPTGLGTLSIFAPLIFVMVLSFGVNKLSKPAAQGLYWAFCVAMGASLASILLTYTHESVARVFFIASGMFAGMSIWGYTTKSNLTSMGSFLIMGLFGLILASVLNFFLHSSELQFAVSLIGVVVFTVLIAYDTQRIKTSYVQFAYADGPDAAAKRSVYDALNLYLNFINLFLMLLRLTGNRSGNN